jgi:hypothetical protein
MPSLTHNIYEWQEMADWCRRPRNQAFHAAGETIAQVLRDRGMSHPEVPLTISGLSDARYGEILEAERRLEAERGQRLPEADHHLADEQESSIE